MSHHHFSPQIHAIIFHLCLYNPTSLSFSSYDTPIRPLTMLPTSVSPQSHIIKYEVLSLSFTYNSFQLTPKEKVFYILHMCRKAH